MAVDRDSGEALIQQLTCPWDAPCTKPHRMSFDHLNACLCVAEAYLRVHSENTWSLPGYSNHLEGEFMVKTAPIFTSDV